MALAIFAGGIAGRTLSETSTTLDQLHRVSTPPAQITDQTAREGDLPSATGAESADAAQGESTTDLPAQNQSTGAENTETIDAPSARSSGDAGVADSPSQGQDSTVADSIVSESGEVADGESLAEQQMAAGKTFDTAPAVAAIEEESAADGEEGASRGGILGELRDRGTEIRDTAEGAAVAAGLTDPSTEPMTIMIMGVDARAGSAIDIGVRPDALMVLRLDPEAQTCSGLAIPRDSWVELPGYGKTKINHALMLGGIPYQQLVVENYLGIEIDHYALIDFTGFQKLVDDVGGVTIVVPPELASPAVSAGTQIVTGEQALRHARYRGGPDGDFGRIKRQQQIMRGLIDAAEGRDLLSEADRLLGSLSEHIRTDMSIEELVSLARVYQERCTADGLSMNQIPGDVVYGPIIDPLFNLPLSYVVSDPMDVRDAVRELMNE